MASLPFKHPKGCTYAKFEEIYMENRGRKDFGDIDGLSKSIKLFGLMQPPICIPLDPPTPEGHKYRLVGGERRIHAMNLLTPAFIPINLRTDVTDEGTLLEMEIEENRCRKEMEWTEYVVLIYRAHHEHTVKNAKLGQAWGAAQTGHLFGKGATHVSHALHVAPLILSGDEEIAKAQSISGAYNILLARAERDGDAERNKRFMAKTKPAGPVSTPTTLPRPASATPSTGISVVPDNDDMSAIFGDTPVLEGTLKSSPSPNGNSTFFNGLTDFPLTSWVTLGDSLTLMASEPAESVDAIITDPPYGIDIDNDHLANMAEVAATHVREENLAMFPEMIKQFYRILKDRAFCIFFCDQEHFHYLKSLAINEGFTVQNHPFYWWKTHQCKNASPSTNFTNIVEIAMVCRKGTATIPEGQRGVLSGIQADGSIERRMYSNPFAKPYAVWERLILATTDPGAVVRDPFAGQMSCPRACLNLGRIPRASELEKHHYDKGMNILRDFIKENSPDATIS